MKINRATILSILLAILLTATLLYFAPILLNRYLDLDTYKTEILSQVEKALNRRVIYQKGELTLLNGPAFTFSGLVVKEIDGTSNFITAEQVQIKLSLMHLLRKEVVLIQLKFEKPSISLSRLKSGAFNISDLLENNNQSTSMNIRKILLSGATINFLDMAIAPEAINVIFSKTDLELGHITRGKKTAIKLNGNMLHAGITSKITLSGDFLLPKQEALPAAVQLDTKLRIKELQPGYFWPYYSEYTPFKKISGLFDLDLSLKGNLANFTTAGNIKVSGLRFDYPQIFHSVLTPQRLDITYNLEKSPTAVKVKSIDLQVDKLKVKGSCDILDIHTSDPRITAKATTSTFRLEEFRGYIPYGIIVKDTANFIEQHIMGGLYRLDEGSLDGRVSQILHMEKDRNYNILYIRGKVEQGLITYGSTVPTFNSIKGELEMKGKDFMLHGMEARFGTSPFTLEGKITDYPLVTPCTYPFSMVMKPLQPEIAWLMGQNRGKQLLFNGDSTLNLNGNGFTHRYSLSGDWDLSNASYSYSDLIRKPAGKSNSANFSGVITKEDFKLSSLRYALSPMVLSIAANYRYTDKPWFGMEIKTNRFPTGEVAPMVPITTKLQPAGDLQAILRGESASGSTDDMRWKGTLSMTGCSFKPPGDIKPLSAITGTVNFLGDSVETSQLSAKLGNTAFNAKGTLSRFKNPSFNLIFSSQLLDPADLGLLTPVNGMRISKIAGDISLRENEIHIASLSGQFNKTALSIKGAIRQINTTPNADIAVTAQHLEVDDILLLTAMEMKKNSPPGAPPTVKASITTESATALDVPFYKVKAQMLLENRILYLQPVNATLAGGKLTGNIRVDTSQTGPDRRIQVGCKLENASADKLLAALGVKKQEIDGTLDLQGEISAKGSSGPEIKRTALGSAKIVIEEGALKRFSTLSKIFSILNLSQLVKFQLPDMVSGGMPFNEITGSFSIKDGVVSTTNLYLDSDAMNISTVGSYNLYKDYLDTTIGVKPLQTIDKVVSRIPIVGWILTGKDKSLVTAYFEAKGKLDNPDVNAVPVKGMAKGVFDIFRRIFELPARLVTDTGEVIIGK